MARPSSILRLASEQEEPRLFIASLVEVMQEVGSGVSGQLAGQGIQPGQNRAQIRFRAGVLHRLRRLVQLGKRMQNILFYLGHNQVRPLYAPCRFFTMQLAARPPASRLPVFGLLPRRAVINSPP